LIGNHHRAMGRHAVTCHMGSHSVRPTCHPTQVNSPRLNPSQPSRYSIYLPEGMEGWVDLGYPAMHAPTGSRTRDLSITSPAPYHYTTEQHNHSTFELVSCVVAPISSMLLSTTATAHSDETSETETRNEVSWPGRTLSSTKLIDTYSTNTIFMVYRRRQGRSQEGATGGHASPNPPPWKNFKRILNKYGCITNEGAMTRPSKVPANCCFLFITSYCNYTWGKLLHIHWNPID